MKSRWSLAVGFLFLCTLFGAPPFAIAVPTDKASMETEKQKIEMEREAQRKRHRMERQAQKEKHTKELEARKQKQEMLGEAEQLQRE